SIGTTCTGHRIAEQTGEDDGDLTFGQTVVRPEDMIAVAAQQAALCEGHDGMIRPHCAGNIGVVVIITAGRGSGHEDLLDFAPILAGSAGTVGVAGFVGSTSVVCGSGIAGTGADGYR